MEANTTKQQTLSEFMTPPKSSRVWTFIFAILMSLMILGAVYEFTKPQEEPTRMSTQLDSGTFSYVDAVLCSDWLVDVSGDEGYTYYEVMDTDGNWFIVDLNDRTFASLALLVEAYNSYFTDYVDNPQDFVLPSAVHLTGMTRTLSNTDAADLSSVFTGSTPDGIFNFYGENYLEVGVNDQNAGAIMYLVGAFVFGLIFLIIVLQTNSQRKNYRKSEDRLYEMGLLDDAETEFSAPESTSFPKSKLVLSKRFLYSGSSGWILPYEDIGWAYQYTQRRYGIPVSKQIIAGHVNGKSISIANRGVNDAMLTETARAIYAANPDCLIGYSFDNIKTYKQRVKEYKQSHPK